MADIIVVVIIAAIIAAAYGISGRRRKMGKCTSDCSMCGSRAFCKK